jgi:hypothetical protein
MTLVISKGITLDNGTRAAAIAGVSPTLDYRFAREKREIETVSLTDKLTFSRTGSAKFLNQSGFLELAGSGVPRFTHAIGGTSLGLLLEGSATNLVTFVETFDNAIWTKLNATITPNVALSPAGNFVADRVVPTATVAAHAVFRGQTGASATRVASIYAKAAGYKNIGVSDAATGQAIFNLETGAIVAQDSGITALAPVNMGNGWWRLAAHRTNTATGIGVDIWNDAITTFGGDGTSGILIWGAQVESGTTPTSLISEVIGSTRNTDSDVIDGTGIITGTYTMVEKPAGCAVVSGTNINLQTGFTAERVMVFPSALSAGQITSIRSAM